MKKSYKKWKLLKVRSTFLHLLVASFVASEGTLKPRVVEPPSTAFSDFAQGHVVDLFRASSSVLVTGNSMGCQDMWCETLRESMQVGQHG